MSQITLPDGSRKRFDDPPSVLEVALSIGPGLAKAALAGRVDDAALQREALLEPKLDRAAARIHLVHT